MTTPGNAPCRIVSLTGYGAFVLTTECGWTTDVEQGVPWPHTEGRSRWVEHDCLTASTGVDAAVGAA